MPKAVSTKAKQKPFILIYKGRRVLIPKPESYQAALSAVAEHFQDTRRKKITFETKKLDLCDGQYTEISASSWDIVVDELKSVTVVAEDLPVQPHYDVLPPTCIGSQSPATPTAAKVKRKIRFSLDSKEIFVVVLSSTSLGHVFDAVAAKFGDDSHALSFYYDGYRLPRGGTVEDAQIEEGYTVDVIRQQLGGKPVIYLRSPKPVEASVILSLVPEWKLSAVYPVVPIKSPTASAAQQISWRVRTKDDGSLTELNTGLDVSYLFWEAETDLTTPMSPPPSPVMSHMAQGHEMFSPTLSDLSDLDAVLLPVDDITPYLDRALKALGLHTEARTSFITYWLPPILKHKYVAFRFVPQNSYERAAPLTITPPPDIITRIFMLFKGVRDDEVADWPAARARATSGVERWRDIVGVDVDRAVDATLFRVLEWGGMEVLRK